MITNKQKEDFKKELLDRQNVLIEHVNHLDEASQSQKDANGELSSYDNHPADIGTALYEREKDQAFAMKSDEELEKINEALHAMEEGTYGLCETCSEPIPLARLAIVPETSTCVEHAEEIGVESVHIKRERDGKTIYREADAIYDIDFDANADGAVDDVAPHKEQVEDANITEEPFL